MAYKTNYLEYIELNIRALRIAGSGYDKEINKENGYDPELKKNQILGVFFSFVCETL